MLTLYSYDLFSSFFPSENVAIVLFILVLIFQLKFLICKYTYLLSSNDGYDHDDMDSRSTTQVIKPRIPSS